jgi:fluoride exporter
VTTLLVVMLAGSIGVGLRYGLDALVTTRAGETFPWSTLVINVLGAFAIGIVAASFAASSIAPGSTLHAAIGIGLLGGFTTFSTFALETVTLVEDGRLGAAASYAAAMNGVGIAACVAGIAAVRALA